jgi:hypothetical protein
MKTDAIGIMEENNCITINFPNGAGGHQLGRLIATCNNVVWYDYEGNGVAPWILYKQSDPRFSKFHFNRRFKGAIGNGVCEKTIIPVGSKSNLNLQNQKKIIHEWKEKLVPNNFVYTLHEPVDIVRNIFGTHKEVFIIPDIEFLYERFMKTSYYYFIDPKDKLYTMGDKLGHDKNKIYDFLQDKISQLENNITQNTFVVNNVKDMLDETKFQELCKHFDLDFNLDRFTAVKSIID